jgi:hypothetical protein
MDGTQNKEKYRPILEVLVDVWCIDRMCAEWDLLQIVMLALNPEWVELNKKDGGRAHIHNISGAISSLHSFQMFDPCRSSWQLRPFNLHVLIAYKCIS